ncbi:Protein of unknown function [Bacillus cereus]|nr:Protein of unknown function [Bacillus cereus]
MRENQVKAFL